MSWENENQPTFIKPYDIINSKFANYITNKKNRLSNLITQAIYQHQKIEI